MKITTPLLCLALAFTTTSFSSTSHIKAQEKAEAKQDQDESTSSSAISIKGKWAVKSGERAGAEVDSERLPEAIMITDDRITIPTPGGDFVMSYKVVSDEAPFHVDMTIEEGPGEGNAVGIVKMENGTLSLCYDPTGENRPKAFKTNEESGFFMFTMKKAASKMDPAKIAGDWQVLSGVRAGDEVTDDRLPPKITFTKDGITIPMGPDMAFNMSYEVDAEKTPAEIDMSIEDGPGAGGNAIGIVKMEDGKFWLCYDPTGENRPEDFESTADNGYFLFEMEAVVD